MFDMKNKLVLTVYGDVENEDDAVDRLSTIVREHDGTWIESKFSSLTLGKFVGMVLIKIDMSFENVFYAHLDVLRADNIHVESIPYVDHIEQNSSWAYVDFSASDKPDAIKNLALSLKRNKIRISRFKAKRVREGDPIVQKVNASFMADVPSSMTHFDFQALLEKNADVLRVTVN